MELTRIFMKIVARMPLHGKNHLVLRLIWLVAVVHAFNSCRERNFLTRSALLSPALSPWQRLIQFGDDSSFLLMTGMNRNAFSYLENLLLQDTAARDPRGRKELLPMSGQLGLYLMYIGSKMGIKHICLLFGVTPSSCSRVIIKMMHKLVRVLKRNDFAAVRFPSEEKACDFAELISSREPQAKNVIGFMDGLSLHTECTSEQLTQNAFYNGYHGDTMVNNVLAYGPDGKVFFCCLNYPGSWHDAAIVQEMMAFLRDKIGDFKICVDQGFPRSGSAFDILVGPYSERTARRLSPILREHLLAMAAVYTSLRQASEWGMRALQATFPRLKNRLPSNASKRKLVLQSIILVHNLRTELVGLNQIATVFNAEYVQYQNIESYDRIRRFYFNTEDFED